MFIKNILGAGIGSELVLHTWDCNIIRKEDCISVFFVLRMFFPQGSITPASCWEVSFLCFYVLILGCTSLFSS